MTSLIVDAFDLDVPGAWEHDLSIARLLGAVHARGENRLVPGTAGVLPKPLRPTEVIVDLQLEVYGDNDAAGTPHADVFEGLTDNLLTLRDFVLDGMDGIVKTRPGVLTVGSRTFETGVQILNWQVVRHALTVAFISYDLRIPSGVWTETTV